MVRTDPRITDRQTHTQTDAQTTPRVSVETYSTDVWNRRVQKGSVRRSVTPSHFRRFWRASEHRMASIGSCSLRIHFLGLSMEFNQTCCKLLQSAVRKQNPDPIENDDKASPIGKYFKLLFLEILLPTRKTLICSNFLQHFWLQHIDVTLQVGKTSFHDIKTMISFNCSTNFSLYS